MHGGDRDGAAVDLVAVHAVSHTSRGVALHLEITAIASDLYASDLHLTTGHTAVDQVDHLHGVEAVVLAKVEAQAAEARVVSAAFALGGASVGALLLVAFLATLRAGVVHIFDHLGVAVIVEHAVELQRQQPLDDVFLLEPLQAAEDGRHEALDLCFVHLHLLQPVDVMEELLLADGLARGQLCALELLADGFFDEADLALLADMADGDRDARLAGAGGASAAVVVRLVVVRQAEVDHVRQVVHVQPARGHVGGHKHVQVAEAELLHHVVALRLAQLAVQRVCVVAVLDQSVGNLLRLLAGAAKDDAVDAGIIIGDALQGGVLVPGVHHVIEVPDVLVALVAATDDDLARLLHVLAGDACDLLRHGGGEEQHVSVLGHFGQDGVDAVREAHVEHLVGLVEDYVADAAEVYRLSVQQVEQSSGRGHDHVHAFPQRLDLALNARSAIDGQHV